MFSESVYILCVCVCVCVCVCAPGVTSSGNDRVLERASLWMIRRQASQSKDEVFCLILCSLEFKTVDPVDILATRAGRVCSLRLEERWSSLSPPPHLSRSLSLALSIGEILIIAVGIPLCYRGLLTQSSSVGLPADTDELDCASGEGPLRARDREYRKTALRRKLHNRSIY